MELVHLFLLLKCLFYNPEVSSISQVILHFTIQFTENTNILTVAYWVMKETQ
jgi:hypothetical protein